MTITLFDNSFVTLDFADTYFLNRPNSNFWTQASSAQKEQALIFATIKVNNCSFIGSKKLKNQKLEFPRDFNPELPLDIQYAVCEEALALLENSAHSKNNEYGISSVSIGKSSVRYFQKNNSNQLLTPSAWIFLSKWTVKNFNIT